MSESRRLREIHKKHYRSFVSDVDSGCKFQGLKKKYRLSSIELTRALVMLPYYRAVLDAEKFMPNALVFNKQKRTRLLRQRANILGALEEVRDECEHTWEECAPNVT